MAMTLIPFCCSVATSDQTWVYMVSFRKLSFSVMLPGTPSRCSAARITCVTPVFSFRRGRRESGSPLGVWKVWTYIASLPEESCRRTTACSRAVGRATEIETRERKDRTENIVESILDEWSVVAEGKRVGNDLEMEDRWKERKCN